jgi:hypothetical protein
MTPEAVFSAANGIALLGWVALAAFPRRRWSAPLVTGAVVPALLGLLYAAVLGSQFGRSHGGFSTLAAVQELFSNPWLLLAGWVHYLAFDLFIGSWQVREAVRRGIPHGLVLPCLFLTFMLGPVGLLLFLVVRWLRTGRLAVGEADPHSAPASPAI